MKRDYYELLGVPRDADAAALKKAYRKLALQHHPDKNPGDPTAEEKFKAVSEAYAVLSDPARRQAFDRYGHAGPPGGGGDFGFSGGFRIDPNDLRDVFGDVFEELFANLFRQRVHHGRDVVATLELTIEEAAAGAEKPVRFKRSAGCPSCAGSGARPGSEPIRCPTCLGQGSVRVQRGFVAMAQPCSRCEGRGVVVPDPCPRCRGGGLITEQVTLSVKVPAGVDEGVKLRLEGEGEPGRQGGMNGDLYVRIAVAPHPFFRREGNNLVCEVPISFPQAALGAQIEVPTLEGKVRVKVPPGTDSGQVLRLKGKGLAAIDGIGRGDQLCYVQIETPRKLTARQRELLEAFERTSEGASSQGVTQPARRGFLERLRDFFD